MNDACLPADILPLRYQHPWLRFRGTMDRTTISILATIARNETLGVHLLAGHGSGDHAEETTFSLVVHREPSNRIENEDILFRVRPENDGFHVLDRRGDPSGPSHATALDALLAILDTCPDEVDGLSITDGVTALRDRLAISKRRIDAREIRYTANIFYVPLFDFNGGLILGRVVGWTNIFGVRLPDNGDIIVIDERLSRRYGFIRETETGWTVIAAQQRSRERNWPVKILNDRRTYCDMSSSFGASVGNLMRLFLDDQNTWLSGHEILDRQSVRKAVRSAVRGKASPDEAFGAVSLI